MSGEPTDADLVERAVRNAGRLAPVRPRWAAVADAFAVGSTSAADLCERFGLDPDEAVGLELPSLSDEDEPTDDDEVPDV